MLILVLVALSLEIYCPLQVLISRSSSVQHCSCPGCPTLPADVTVLLADHACSLNVMPEQAHMTAAYLSS